MLRPPPLAEEARADSKLFKSRAKLADRSIPRRFQSQAPLSSQDRRRWGRTAGIRQPRAVAAPVRSMRCLWTVNTLQRQRQWPQFELFTPTACSGEGPLPAHGACEPICHPCGAGPMSQQGGYRPWPGGLPSTGPCLPR
eukprot:scaffold3319_cov427-Prasinococcus_capsulatus_cf.AAC.9